MQLSVTLCTKLVDGDVSVGKNLSRLPSKDLLLGRNPTLPWGHVCFFVAVFFHHVTAQWTGSQPLHVNSASIRYCRTTVAQNIQLAWEQRECDFTVERNSVSCLMRTAHAGFLSDTIHCPTVTSKSVCTTVPDACSLSLHSLTRIAVIVHGSYGTSGPERN